VAIVDSVDWGPRTVGHPCEYIVAWQSAQGSSIAGSRAPTVDSQSVVEAELVALLAAALSPLVREECVSDAVHPLAGAVQRVTSGVCLSAHSNSLHELP
jgi:hypothetical protein